MPPVRMKLYKNNLSIYTCRYGDSRWGKQGVTLIHCSFFFLYMFLLIYVSFNKSVFHDLFQTFDDCVRLRDPDCTSPVNFYTLIPYFCGHEPFCLWVNTMNQKPNLNFFSYSFNWLYKFWISNWHLQMPPSVWELIYSNQTLGTFCMFLSQVLWKQMLRISLRN